MYINVESYPSHPNTEDTLGKNRSACCLFPALHCPLVLPLQPPLLLPLSGCSYDKQMRSFADDVCVVPEKFEGWERMARSLGDRWGHPASLPTAYPCLQSWLHRVPAGVVAGVQTCLWGTPFLELFSQQRGLLP